MLCNWDLNEPRESTECRSGLGEFRTVEADTEKARDVKLEVTASFKNVGRWWPQLPGWMIVQQASCKYDGRCHAAPNWMLKCKLWEKFVKYNSIYRWICTQLSGHKWTICDIIVTASSCHRLQTVVVYSSLAEFKSKYSHCKVYKEARTARMVVCLHYLQQVQNY